MDLCISRITSIGMVMMCLVLQARDHNITVTIASEFGHCILTLQLRLLRIRGNSIPMSKT
jgi:hypothetical protein